MASSGNGLNSVSTIVASRSVDPVAKYQWSEAVDAHGVADQPDGPVMASSTAAPPPSRSTTAASADAGTTSGSATNARDRPFTGIDSVFGAPVLGTAVTRAVNGLSVGFRMVTRPMPPDAPGVAGAAGQYHVEFRAPTGAAVGMRAATAGSAAAATSDADGPLAPDVPCRRSIRPP